MISLSDCKDFFVQYGAWVAAICSVTVGVLTSFESTSHFTESLVGMHYPVESSSGYDEVPVLYKIGAKDIRTILLLHLPIHAIFSFIWDHATNHQPLPGETSESSDQFRFYVTARHMLLLCFVLDAIVKYKEDYSDVFPLEWNGPQGHMTFLVKLCFLVQMAVLCYYLELLFFSELSITLMRDSWIVGILSLDFVHFCYMLNLVPLKVSVCIQHFAQQGNELLLNTLSLMELSETEKYWARFMFRVHVFFDWMDAIYYMTLIMECLIFAIKSSILGYVLLLVPLSAFFVLSVSRISGIRNFDLNTFQYRNGVQAS